MKITILETEQEFFNLVGWRVAMEMTKQPEALFGFSTGRTTGGIHAAMAEIYKKYKFDTSRLSVFGIDEITNISPEYFGSCYYMLLHEIVKPLGIPLENYIMPPTYSDDFEQECVNFEAALKARGDVVLQVLGLGENGHIGFNQPGTPFGSRTWLSKMDEALDERIRRETNSPPGAQLDGLTLGITNLMHSKKILLVANGERKAQIVRDTVCGPVTEDVPSSILQLHPDCELIVDAAAGKLVRLEAGNDSCSCTNLNCENHRDCAACITSHESKDYEPHCRRGGLGV